MSSEFTCQIRGTFKEGNPDLILFKPTRVSSCFLSVNPKDQGGSGDLSFRELNLQYGICVLTALSPNFLLSALWLSIAGW